MEWKYLHRLYRYLTDNTWLSVVTMDLVVNYSIATNDSLVVCDSAIWNGNTYNTTGIYIDTLQTTHGCDSVVTMDLVVNYSASSMTL